MSKISKPGIYTDISAEDYFADCCPEPSFTQSIGKVLIEQSPAHARLEHPRLAPPTDEEEEPEKYDSAKAIGNAAHALMIGRGKTVAVGDFKNWMTKEAKAFKEDAILHGKMPIITKHMARAHSMVKAARDQLDDAGHKAAFRDGQGEVVLAWQEEGFWFRTMIDWLVDTTLPYDLKTSAMSCAPHLVAERPSEQGWDVQCAMHERALDVLDPANAGRRKYHFIAQENKAPFGLVAVRISEADLTMGRKKLQYAIDMWKLCLSTGAWPAYSHETVMSRPRGYTETKWLNREIEHEEQKKRGAMLGSDHLMAG